MGKRQVNQILASLDHPATPSVNSHDDDDASDSNNSASPKTSHKLSFDNDDDDDVRICHTSLSLSDDDDDDNDDDADADADPDPNADRNADPNDADDADPNADFNDDDDDVRICHTSLSLSDDDDDDNDDDADADADPDPNADRNADPNDADDADPNADFNDDDDDDSDDDDDDDDDYHHHHHHPNADPNADDVTKWPRFVDFGGMEKVIDKLKREVIMPFLQPKLAEYFGVTQPNGLLLHGPPGCGKTSLAHAIANEMGVPFYQISAPEVVSGCPGDSEEKIRSLFRMAYRTAPSIVFIDEIDAIGSKRDNLLNAMERRIVTQLITCMDRFHQGVHHKPTGNVLVIGATNRPDALDLALRRTGRFDLEIALSVPDEAARVHILSMLTKGMRLEGKLDFSKIARLTSGFVGADLKFLVNKAGNLAMNKVIDKKISCLNLQDWRRWTWDESEMEGHSITMADFEKAAKMVQPTLRREGFSSIPNVTWDDVGGLSLIRNVFDEYIVQRIKNPEVYEKMLLTFEGGVLLFGPPGCGKTLIAKAVANEAGANFIHIKGPELLNKYVGESESELRKLFARARTNSPCIIFFDEVDALTTRRGKQEGSVIDRLVNQLLIELHGADDRQGVFVIGATNRIEVMDQALLRPGRFEKILYVPLPGADERVAILKACARKRPIDADVDLDALARMERCNNLSGADLASLVDEAARFAIREILANETSIYECSIKASHFEHALSKITPSVTDEQRKYYEALSNKYQAG